jgi:dTDP-4-dehydrorhamnose 3,5-epimerase
MRFTPTPLRGAFIIEPEKHEDNRGFFARMWCQRELAEHAIDCQIVQANISGNKRKGTLRGMHYQAAPFAEAKFLRCTRGSAFAAIVDMRSQSSTFLQHITVILSSENYVTLYVPKGFANGFQTLEDDTEILYQMSEYFSPEHSRGIRWSDPVLNIAWPADERIISDRDLSLPFLESNLSKKEMKEHLSAV